MFFLYEHAWLPCRERPFADIPRLEEATLQAQRGVRPGQLAQCRQDVWMLVTECWDQEPEPTRQLTDHGSGITTYSRHAASASNGSSR